MSFSLSISREIFFQEPHGLIRIRTYRYVVHFNLTYAKFEDIVGSPNRVEEQVGGG